MLDTGFSISVVDPRLADLLKLKRTGKTTIAGIAGEEQADVYEGAVFDFAGASYSPRRVTALPSDKNKRRRRMEGILGAGFFRRFVVELDPKGKTIQLHDPKTYEYSGPGESLPINLRNTTPVVEASINIPGRPSVRGRFEIDTGCDGGLCLGHDFVEANKLLEAGGQIQRGGRTGVGGDAQTKVGSVPQLQLGRLTVDKPEANFFLTGSPVERHLAGHIGMEVLRQFKVIFDYSRQRMILEPDSSK
jgi:predicted aspartyl protease